MLYLWHIPSFTRSAAHGQRTNAVDEGSVVWRRMADRLAGKGKELGNDFLVVLATRLSRSPCEVAIDRRLTAVHSLGDFLRFETLCHKDDGLNFAPTQSKALDKAPD